MPAAARAQPPVSEAAAPAGHSMMQLAADWRVAYAQAEAEERRLSQALTAAEALYPPMPPGMATLRRPLWAAEQAAQKLWEDQTAVINSAFGVPGLDQVTNRAFMAAGAIAKEILAMRPTTAAEAALKYGIMLERVRDGRGEIDDAKPVFAFLDDLEHLAKLEQRL